MDVWGALLQMSSLTLRDHHGPVKGDCAIPEANEAPELGSQSYSALAGAYTRQGSPYERLGFTQNLHLTLALCL